MSYFHVYYVHSCRVGMREEYLWKWGGGTNFEFQTSVELSIEDRGHRKTD